MIESFSENEWQRLRRRHEIIMKKLTYQSTRGGESGVSPSQAVLKGIASDGGLFMPEEIPQLDRTMEELSGMSYKEIAYEVMKLYLTDFTEAELKDCIEKAYDSKFDTEQIAPVVKAATAYFLELFHGNTIAFKDMALSILPHLMTVAARKNKVDKEIVILTATSGDTGKAALAGFAGVPGTRIIVFYPKNGVSHMQELQMVTQKGDNTAVIAIHGNFDDAQTGVKKIFGDEEFAKKLDAGGFQLSSANSINVGRLIPQVVYYVYAYANLLARGEIENGEKINVAVPTGNFGNILAGYLAKQMGVPIGRLLCASNENKVLYDFFTTGTYDRNREFVLTSSPSMDILVSSNLERLIYLSCGRDPEKTARLMKDLAEKGRYTVTKEMQKRMKDFVGGYASEEEDARAIHFLYKNRGYVIDPHTGVAAAVWKKYRDTSGDDTKTVIVSTASPYKFTRSVLEAIHGPSLTEDEFAMADELERLSMVPVPGAIRELKNAQIRHTAECDVEDMEENVGRILGIA